MSILGLGDEYTQAKSEFRPLTTNRPCAQWTNSKCTTGKCKVCYGVDDVKSCLTKVRRLTRPITPTVCCHLATTCANTACATLETSLKRHGYYCRSRTGQIAPRNRACKACSAGKARCDNEQPTCSRCRLRGLNCSYPVHKGQRPGHDERNGQDGTEPPQSVLGATGENLTSSCEADAGFLNALSGPDGTGLDWDQTDMGLIDMPTSFQGFLSGLLDSDSLGFAGPDSALLSNNPLPGVNPAMKMQMELCSLGTSIPRQPTLHVRSLVTRTIEVDSKQKVAGLLLSTLKGYTQMTLRGRPPFIHPSWLSSNVDHDDLEPLHNCISLMHMYRSGVRGSSKLLWRNVRHECEWMGAECGDMTLRSLLASLQSLLIFIIVRLGEGETDYNNLDFLLISTVSRMGRATNASLGTCPRTCSLTWEDWITLESLRRICTAFQVIDLLVFFDPAALCEHPPELVLAPLPAKKQLWEAPDEAMWKFERDLDSAIGTDYGLAAGGGLVEIVQTPLYPGCKLTLEATTDWDDWCSGMDSFGALITLAASLVA